MFQLQCCSVVQGTSEFFIKKKTILYKTMYNIVDEMFTIDDNGWLELKKPCITANHMFVMYTTVMICGCCGEPQQAPH